MSFSIKISKAAKAETRQIFEYLADYSPYIADKHLVRLTNSISLIGRDPFLCPFFFLAGAPYRAKLFSVGRTSFWIVYQVDAPKRTVNILRMLQQRLDQWPDVFLEQGDRLVSVRADFERGYETRQCRGDQITSRPPVAWVYGDATSFTI